jgi:hypothetical protein
MMAAAASKLLRSFATQIETLRRLRASSAIFRIRVKTMASAAFAKDPWVLVEGPGPGDAEFLGRWLLAAVEADQALQEQFKRNTQLRDQISRLEVTYQIRFSPAATKFVELLMKDLTSFSLSVWTEWGEIFTVMAELGFFSLTGERYQMTLPKAASGPNIEVALLRLAATEDQDYFLHPEHLLTCLSKPVVLEWQRRLERLPWMHRVADRAVLLGQV